jgi:hypothetical protein
MLVRRPKSSVARPSPQPLLGFQHGIPADAAAEQEGEKHEPERVTAVAYKNVGQESENECALAKKRVQSRGIRTPRNPVHVRACLSHPHMHANCSL